MTRTEKALQTLLDLIRNNIIGIIRSSPGEYDNCPDPIEYVLGMPNLQRATQTPILAVDIDTQQLTQLTLGQPLASKRQRVLPALIHIIHAHRDREQLYRQTLQLVDAILHLLELYPQSEYYLYQSPRLADYTPPIEAAVATQPYLTVATITTNIIVIHRSGTATP